MSTQERATLFAEAADEFAGEQTRDTKPPKPTETPTPNPEPQPAPEPVKKVEPPAPAPAPEPKPDPKPQPTPPPPEPKPEPAKEPAKPAGPVKSIVEAAVEELLKEELPDPTSDTGKTTVEELRKGYPQMAGYVEKLIAKATAKAQEVIQKSSDRVQQLEDRIRQYEPTMERNRAAEQDQALSSLLSKVAEGDDGIANHAEILNHPGLAEWFKAQAEHMQAMGNSSTDPDEVKFFLSRAAKALGVEIKRGTATTAKPVASAKPKDNSALALKTTLRGTGGGNNVPSGDISSNAELRDVFNEAATEFEKDRPVLQRRRK